MQSPPFLNLKILCFKPIPNSVGRRKAGELHSRRGKVGIPTLVWVPHDGHKPLFAYARLPQKDDPLTTWGTRGGRQGPVYLRVAIPVGRNATVQTQDIGIAAIRIFRGLCIKRSGQKQVVIFYRNMSRCFCGVAVGTPQLLRHQRAAPQPFTHPGLAPHSRGPFLFTTPCLYFGEHIRQRHPGAWEGRFCEVFVGRVRSRLAVA
jgi:hypothetical protein